MARDRRRKLNSLGALLRDFADEGLDLARDEVRESIRGVTQSRSTAGKDKTGSRANNEADGLGGSERFSRDSRRSVDSGRDDAVDELRDAVRKLSEKIDDLAKAKAKQRPDG